MDSPQVENALGTAVRSLPSCLADTRYGRMIYHQRDVFIGKSFENYGEYGEIELQLLKALVKAGDVIVEAGSNIGADTIPLAHRVGESGRVFAFEPQRLIFQMLCANVALNGLPNVIAYWAAVSDVPGTLQMPALDYHILRNYGGISVAREGNGYPVMSLTVDSFKLSKCALIKADVEGMEELVIRGAVETIRRHRPRLYVENNGGAKSQALIELLFALRYRLFWHTPPLFNPDNFAKNSENIFPGIVSSNMLCLPVEDETKVQGLRKITDSRDAALPLKRF